MFALKTILVPIDFGEASGRALEVARFLADACGASLHLLHVSAPALVGAATGPGPRGAAVRHDVEPDARRRLDALLDAADRDRRHAATACREGTPGFEIVAYAADNQMDLIVMGTHSHGPTFQMLSGSIAEHVIRRASCPVLTVKSVEDSSRETDLDCAATAART